MRNSLLLASAIWVCATVLHAAPVSATASDWPGPGCPPGGFTAAGSPWNLTADITVGASTTCTVQAGTTIEGNSHVLQVQAGGTLQALGTSSASRDVVFDNVTVQVQSGGAATLQFCTLTWNSYYYYAPLSLSNNETVTGCTISGTGYYAVYVGGGAPTISNSTITASSNGIQVDAGTPTIHANSVTASNGIYLNGGNPSVDSNTITASNMGVYYGGGNGTANGNTIGFGPTGTGRTGIYVASAAAPTLTGNTILDDPAQSDTGISIGGAGVAIANNTITVSGGDIPLQLPPDELAAVSGTSFPTGLGAGVALTGAVRHDLTLGTFTPGPGTVVSTYMVQSVSVTTGITLTIAPGITLSTPTTYGFGAVTVYGTLHAVGTSTATRDIVFDNVAVQVQTGGAATLQFCTVTWTYPYYYYGPLWFYDSATVTGCTVTSSGSYGVYTAGGASTISSNTITSGGYGILIDAGAATVQANSVTASSGIYIGGGTPSIGNNMITASYAGVYYSGGGGTASSNTISFGPTGTGRIGIYVANGATPTLTGNTILDDPAQSDTGINVAGSGVAVVNNTVTASGGDIALQLSPDELAAVTGTSFPTGLGTGVTLTGTLSDDLTLGAFTPGPGTVVSTYLVQNLSVPAGTLLTIAPGITLSGSATSGYGGTLTVYGTLQAVGTSTANRDVVFDNVMVQLQAGGTATLQFCTLTWSSYYYYAPLWLYDTATVTDCTITGTGSYGVYLAGGAPILDSNTIAVDGYYGGIYVAAGTPTIHANSVTAYDGIYVGGGAPSIDGNLITAANVGLLYYSGGGGTASGNTIGFGPTGAGRTGIYVASGATPTLAGNTILDDPAQNDTGINIVGTGVPVSNNSITVSGGDIALQLPPDEFTAVSGTVFPTGLGAGVTLTGTLTDDVTLGTFTPGPGTVVSTYMVQSLSVPAGTMLTITPGITLNGSTIYGYGSLTIDGTLQAVGTSDASRDVVFDNVIVQVDPGGTAMLQFCTLTWSNYYYYAPLWLYDTATVTGCTISGTGYYGVYLAGGTPTLENNTIAVDGYYGGIYVTAGTPTIHANSVTAYDGVYVVGGDPSISNNVVTAGNVGLYYSAGGGTASGNTIGFSASGTGRTGIYVAGGATPTLDGNTILDDPTQSDTAISIAGSGVAVVNNTVTVSGGDIALQLPPDELAAVTGTSFPTGMGTGVALAGSVAHDTTLGTFIPGPSTVVTTYVLQNLSIGAGVTLTITPATTLQSLNYYGGQLTVYGNLQAVGTSSVSRDVVFDNVQVNVAPGGNAALQYCTLTGTNYYYYYYSAPLYLQDSATVRRCTITTPGVYGVFVASGAAVIRSNRINAGNYGVYVAAGAPTINANSVTASDGIYVTGGAPTISSNTITASAVGLYYTAGGGSASANAIGFGPSGTARTGIYVADGATPTLDGNTILDDPAQSDTGITIVGTGVPVSNNTITASGGDVPLQLTPDEFAAVINTHFPSGLGAGVAVTGSVTHDATLGTFTPGPGIVVTTYVVQNLSVTSGVTLTIAPGTTLQSSAYYGGTLTVYGTLYAVGSSNANRDVSFDNVTVQVQQGGMATLQFCIVNWTAYFYGGQLSFYDSATVTACTIAGNGYYGGVYVGGGSPTLSANDLTVSYDGVYIAAGSPEITGNSITTGSVGLAFSGSAGETAAGNTISYTAGGSGRMASG